MRPPNNMLTDSTIRTILCIGYMEETNMNALSKMVGMTYNHMYIKIIPKLVSWGCVVLDEKKGRNRNLRLTCRGFEIFKRLQEIGELLGTPISEAGDKRLDLMISSGCDNI